MSAGQWYNIDHRSADTHLGYIKWPSTSLLCFIQYDTVLLYASAFAIWAALISAHAHTLCSALRSFSLSVLDPICPLASRGERFEL